MAIHIPSDSDIKIPIAIDTGVRCAREVRQKIAKNLFSLYKSGKIANLARTFATCPICGKISKFTNDDESLTPLSRCVIVKESEEGTIVVPAQWIHILQEHDAVVHPNLLKYFQEL